MVEHLRLFCLPLTLVLTSSSWGIDASLFVQQHSYCGRASGVVLANVSGGVPPYTYQWSDGSTGISLVGVGAGMYTLTVTDSQLDQATAEGEVLLLTSYDYEVSSPPAIMHCPGDPMQVAIFTGMDAPGIQPLPQSIYGPNPYTFNAPGLAQLGQSVSCGNPYGTVWEILTFTGVSPGYTEIAYADANGCPGTMTVPIGGPMSWPNVQILDIVPSCPNWGTGSIVFSYQSTDPLGTANVKWRADGDPTSCGNQISRNYLANGYVGTIPNIPPGDYWLIISNDMLDLYEGSVYSYLECKDSIMVTVPELAQDCGRVTGRLYIDENMDCIAGGSENRIPESIIEITPGPHYVTTSNSGQYTAYLPLGTYSIAEQNATYVQSCTAAVTISSGNSQTVNVGCEGGVPMDVQVAMANGPARPGFELEYAVDIDNLTSGSPGIVTLTMNFDPALGYSWAFPTPTNVSGNTLTWTAPSFNLNTPFAHRDVNVHFQIPSDVGLIGTTLNTAVTLTTEFTDADLANNTVTSTQLVTGSFDPNDKVATTSTAASSSQYFIDSDEWIDYTIRFQNTGTDTAFNVIITDTLPASLDPGSVQWGASSHTGSRSLSGTGLLKFIFPGILLPDSNVNEAASHGFVSFRIKPREPILPGTVIENIANIYFDFNPPVITEPSVLVAEFITGVDQENKVHVHLQPNPVTDLLWISSEALVDKISIVAADGREVMRHSIRASTATLDVSRLVPGTYFLVATTRKGTLERDRFIKY